MEERYEHEKLYKESKILDHDIFSRTQNPRGRPEYLMPKGTEVLELPSRLEIVMDASSRSKRYKYNIAFAAMILNIATLIILLSGVWVNLIALFVMLLFTVFGLGLSVETFRMFFNKRTIVIEDNFVRITETPLTFKPLLEDIHIDDIDQLFVQRYQTNLSVNDVPVEAHALYLIKKDGSRIKIIDNSNKETVLFLEQNIERHLGIIDYAIDNEVT